MIRNGLTWIGFGVMGLAFGSLVAQEVVTEGVDGQGEKCCADAQYGFLYCDGRDDLTVEFTNGLRNQNHWGCCQAVYKTCEAGDARTTEVGPGINRPDSGGNYSCSKDNWVFCDDSPLQ